MDKKCEPFHLHNYPETIFTLQAFLFAMHFTNCIFRSLTSFLFFFSGVCMTEYVCLSFVQEGFAAFSSFLIFHLTAKWYAFCIWPSLSNALETHDFSMLTHTQNSHSTRPLTPSHISLRSKCKIWWWKKYQEIGHTHKKLYRKPFQWSL